MVILICDFLIFCQFFLFLEVKQNMIASGKNGIYDLSQKLPTNLRLHIFIISKILNFKLHQSSLQSSIKNQNFVNNSIKLRKIRYSTFRIMDYFALNLKFFSNI